MKYFQTFPKEDTKNKRTEQKEDYYDLTYYCYKNPGKASKNFAKFSNTLIF